MPVLKHAKKKLRVDLRRKTVNKVVKTKATKALDKARKETTPEFVSQAFSAIDKAAKNKVFHHKKADRLKSRLANLLAKAK